MGMTNSSVKYEVFVNQYLCVILDVLKTASVRVVH